MVFLFTFKERKQYLNFNVQTFKDNFLVADLKMILIIFRISFFLKKGNILMFPFLKEKGYFALKVT